MGASMNAGSVREDEVGDSIRLGDGEKKNGDCKVSFVSVGEKMAMDGHVVLFCGRSWMGVQSSEFVVW